ncbi:MAG: viroplasmin family protein, partial [Erysipelotrichaceae bacterium]|nr:viroplasmin family protein [Erysipelotrichaceae bacterium]
VRYIPDIYLTILIIRGEIMGKYYAVKVGRAPGIYNNWDECQLQTDKYPGAIFKKFNSKQEAEAYLGIPNEQPKPFKQKKQVYTHQKFTNEQQKAYNMIMSGQNVFLTGEAGTGISYVIQAFVKENEKLKKKIIVCAPTGIAAIQISGVTIHRVFQVSPEPQINTSKAQVPKTVKEADIIIIDEISMCRIDLFDYIISVIKKAESMSKPKQIIVVGDFFQLPPVTNNHD